jgi:hypothetical protein
MKFLRKFNEGASSRLSEIGDRNSQIYNYIKVHNSNNELLQDFKVGLNRLSEEYPYYKLKFTDYVNSIFIEIFKNKEEEEYPF